jgi:hypothetical protein
VSVGPSSDSPRYERIGRDYARTRREDPVLARRIDVALGDARSVVNVGAGTGLYEPQDRHVIAIEPSDVMAAQRDGEREAGVRELRRVARGPVVIVTFDPDRRHGRLRELDDFDVGMRLLVNRPGSPVRLHVDG